MRQPYLSDLPQISVLLLKAILQTSDFNRRGRECFVGTFARKRLCKYFTYESDPADQVDRPDTGFTESAKADHSYYATANAKRNAHVRTDVRAPNVIGFSDRLSRKIVGQRLKYDHLAGKKLAAIPRKLRQKRTSRYGIDAVDRVRAQDVERTIFQELGESASIEPEKLPNPQQRALSFDPNSSAARFANFEESSTSRRSNANSSSADTSGPALDFAGLLKGMGSAIVNSVWAHRYRGRGVPFELLDCVPSFVPRQMLTRHNSSAHSGQLIQIKFRLSLLLLFLQHDIDRLNDGFSGIGLAIDDHVVNPCLGARHVKGVLFRQPVVPAAVPNSQKVGVFLERARQLRAGQFLDIDVALGIGVIL